MAYHRFVTISGQRFDITNVPVIAESACDNCGSFMRYSTTVQVPAELTPDIGGPNAVELCDSCVTLYHPGLIDLARKVHARA